MPHGFNRLHHFHHQCLAHGSWFDWLHVNDGLTWFPMVRPCPFYFSSFIGSVDRLNFESATDGHKLPMQVPIVLGNVLVLPHPL